MTTPSGRPSWAPAVLTLWRQPWVRTALISVATAAAGWYASTLLPWVRTRASSDDVKASAAAVAEVAATAKAAQAHAHTLEQEKRELQAEVYWLAREVAGLRAANAEPKQRSKAAAADAARRAFVEESRVQTVPEEPRWQQATRKALAR